MLPELKPELCFDRRRLLQGGLLCCSFPHFAWVQAAEPLPFASDVSLMQMLTHPLLRAYYGGPPRNKVGPDGRAGFNLTGSHAPLIEEQRAGTEWVLHGSIAHKPDFVTIGWKALDFGRNWQEPDGGFGRYGYYHANSLYLEGLARALVIDPAAATPARLDCLNRGLAWMRSSVNADQGQQQNTPYTHRNYIIAAMYGQAAMVLKNPSLNLEAHRFARKGLVRQRADGVNPELGGFDANYQMAGVLFALRYYPTASADLLHSLRQMIHRAIATELRVQQHDGSLASEGSTRVGREAVSGVIKQPNYIEIFQALCYADRIIPTFAWRAAAVAAARFYGLPLPLDAAKKVHPAP